MIDAVAKEHNDAEQRGLQSGTLYIVSTPIGNLRDMTLRGLDTLRAVDVVAAEDTRHSGILLKQYEIHQPLVSFHEHNKESQTPRLIERLLRGETIALISDAGTPGISDPGFYLIRAVLQQTGLSVQAIPGATALIPALILSGLPVHRFAFEGFPPAKKGRKTFFRELIDEPRTIILYESALRLPRTLEDILEFLGDRQIAVARELTKKFEEVIRGSVSEVIASFSSRAPKGEIVIVVEGSQSRVKRREKRRDEV